MLKHTRVPCQTFAGCIKPPASGPIACPSQGNTSGVIAVASRAASNITVLGPRPVWVGIATAAIPASASKSYAARIRWKWGLGGNGSSSQSQADQSRYTSSLLKQSPRAMLVQILRSRLPLSASAWADADGPQSVAEASKAWWSAFWSRSSVVIGENTTNTLPEAMWWGAQVRHWIGVFVRVRVRVHS